MSKEYCFIILALARWDNEYTSTIYSLAKEFSKNHTVFFIDNPFTIKDYLLINKHPQIKRRRFGFFKRGKCDQLIHKEVDGKIISITMPLMLPIHFSKYLWIAELLSNWNNFLFTQRLKFIVKKYKVKEFVFLNSFNPFYGLQIRKDFNPKTVIYQSVDEIEAAEHISRFGAHFEAKWVNIADFIITTSQNLKIKFEKLTRKVFLINNAVDFNFFHQAYGNNVKGKPVELHGTSEKIIGYIGNIDERIDFEMLFNLVSSLPQKLFLFVGPINTTNQMVSHIKEQENTIFTGGMDMQELPLYLKWIDVAIIPFCRNEFTKSIFPLKLNEYFAAGKPVVTTNFSTDISMMKDLLYLAEDDFVDLVELALLESSEELTTKRIEFAKYHSWTNKVKEIKSLVAEFEVNENKE